MDITKVREFIATCPFLDEFAPIKVNMTDANPVNYGISDQGCITVSTDIMGNRTKRHSFALFMNNYTLEDSVRIENSQFVGNFQKWMEEQDDIENYPEVSEGQSIEHMGTNNGRIIALHQDGQTGLYEIPFYMEYLEVTHG